MASDQSVLVISSGRGTTTTPPSESEAIYDTYVFCGFVKRVLA